MRTEAGSFLCLVWIADLALLLCLQGRPLPAQRTVDHIYLLDCGGELHKVDRRTGQEEVVINLALRTSTIHTHNSTGGTVDGCSTNGAVYSSAAASVYTLAPVNASANVDNHQYYRLLSFHLPGAIFKGAVAIPGAYDTPPALRMDVSQQVEVFTQTGRWILVDGKLVLSPASASVLPAADLSGVSVLDLHGYKVVSSTDLPAKVYFTALQSSGGTFLLRYVQSGKGFAYAVLRPEKHSFTVLELPFHTLPEHLLLAPGGTAVLAQQVLLAGPVQEAKSTAKVALLSTTDGKLLKQWNEPLLAGRSASGLTPDGSLVLFDGKQYCLRQLGVHFPSDQVYILDDPYRTLPFLAP